MRTITLTEKKIDDFQPHLDRVMSILTDAALDEDKESIHEFCRFIDHLFGPFPETSSA